MVSSRGVLFASIVFASALAGSSEQSWKRHAVDASSAGADGVRLADVNADGRPDIVTGWEEGGRVRLYLNPGPEKAASPWPAVTVGAVPSPEDAVLADLDGDGQLDVVSSTEGDSRTLFVHWAPSDPARRMAPGAWTTDSFPGPEMRRQWMFALPFDVDDRHGIDLAVGSKNNDGVVGLLIAPKNPRDLAAWRWQPLYQAGWIMSLIASDMDSDGDLDLFVTDRTGPRRGCLWLENPGRGDDVGAWREHRIGPVDEYEAMFAKVVDLDADGMEDVVVAARPSSIFIHRRMSADGDGWESTSFALPEGAGQSKAVAVADLDLDGALDIAFTCEHAENGLEGAAWLSHSGSPLEGKWTPHTLAGPGGVKFDRIELVDLDEDGDPDLLTCEERQGGRGLGVIWYENPAR